MEGSTQYHNRLRCNMLAGSSVSRKQTALPLPSSISLPSSLSVATMYSSSSSSSSPGNPSRLKNAQRKNSFKLSLFMVSAGAPRNHVRKYTSGSDTFALQSAKSSRLRSCEGAGGCLASDWRCCRYKRCAAM